MRIFSFHDWGQKITFNGKTQNVAQWEQELGFKKDSIAKRIRANWSPEKALTTPIKYQNKFKNK